MGLYPRQSARVYPWQGDNIARSGLNSVATLLPFSGLMRVWIFYIFSHFNLLYLNLLNYSSYSDIRAYSACSRAQICELCSALLSALPSGSREGLKNRICEYAQPMLSLYAGEATQRAYLVWMLSAAGGIKQQGRIIGKSLCCMGLESEIQTLVKTLVQGKSKGSLKTLAGTDFETLARLWRDSPDTEIETLTRV